MSNHCSSARQYDFEEKLNFAVFPATQGGPHNNHITALAMALKQVASLEYRAYIRQVKENAQALAFALLRRKCKLVTGGTDDHLLVRDLTSVGLSGKNFEKVREMCNISVNKAAIFSENGAISLGGARIGTSAMTSRECVESNFETITEFLLWAAQITLAVWREHGKSQADFLSALENNRDSRNSASKLKRWLPNLPGSNS